MAMTAMNDNKANYLYIPRQNIPINVPPGGFFLKIFVYIIHRISNDECQIKKFEKNS